MIPARQHEYIIWFHDDPVAIVTFGCRIIVSLVTATEATHYKSIEAAEEAIATTFMSHPAHRDHISVLPIPRHSAQPTATPNKQIA